MKVLQSERYIEQYLVKKIKSIGGLCYKFVSPSNIGVPDRIIFYKGKTYLVELKANSVYAKLSQMQHYQISKLMQQAIPVEVINSTQRVDEFVNEIYKPDKEIYCDNCNKKIIGAYYTSGDNICLECTEDLIVKTVDGFYTLTDYDKDFYMDDELSDIPMYEISTT